VTDTIAVSIEINGIKTETVHIQKEQVISTITEFAFHLRYLLPAAIMMIDQDDEKSEIFGDALMKALSILGGKDNPVTFREFIEILKKLNQSVLNYGYFMDSWTGNTVKASIMIGEK
jgi:hypothetical protein